MNILKSLREVWLGIGTVKDKSVGVKSVSVESTDKVDSVRLISFDDSGVFEEKLDEILLLFTVKVEISLYFFLFTLIITYILLNVSSIFFYIINL